MSSILSGPSFASFIANKVAGQAAPAAGVDTVLTLDNLVSNLNGRWVTATTRFVAGASEVWQFTFWQTDSLQPLSDWNVFLRKNGATKVGHVLMRPGAQSVFTVAVVPVVAGDYLELVVNSAAGATGLAATCGLSGTRIG